MIFSRSQDRYASTAWMASLRRGERLSSLMVLAVKVEVETEVGSASWKRLGWEIKIQPN